MSRGILVSPKHGVNPAMGVCFWCGKPDGSILLLGRLPQDAEAPRHVCASYEPCDTCKASMGQGITIIECQRTPSRDGQVSLTGKEDAYPTGNWWVLKESAFRSAVHDGAVLERTLKSRRCLVTPEVARQVGLYGDVAKA